MLALSFYQSFLLFLYLFLCVCVCVCARSRLSCAIFAFVSNSNTHFIFVSFHFQMFIARHTWCHSTFLLIRIKFLTCAMSQLPFLYVYWASVYCVLNEIGLLCMSNIYFYRRHAIKFYNRKIVKTVNIPFSRLKFPSQWCSDFAKHFRTERKRFFFSQ